MTFNSGKEMLDVLTDCCDLYSEDREIYVFNYNSAGSIAYYSIPKEEMSKFVLEADGDEISGFLGPGRICDDPSHELYKEGDYSNLDWCNDNYEGEWMEV